MIFCGWFPLLIKPRVWDIFITEVCFITGISLAHLKAWRRPAAALLLVSNLVLALYTGLIHQRGTLDVMSHLQRLCEVSSDSARPQSDVFFLMPCHSTPFYRYTHTKKQCSVQWTLNFFPNCILISFCILHQMCQTFLQIW